MGGLIGFKVMGSFCRDCFQASWSDDFGMKMKPGRPCGPPWKGFASTADTFPPITWESEQKLPQISSPAWFLDHPKREAMARRHHFFSGQMWPVQLPSHFRMGCSWGKRLKWAAAAAYLATSSRKPRVSPQQQKAASQHPMAAEKMPKKCLKVYVCPTLAP